MWRWRGVPRGIRWIVAVQVVVLSYGGVVHVVQLATGGRQPYPWAPAWLAAYFISLTVLDFLAAGLLGVRRAAGLWLSVAILVTDAAANAYAVYSLTGAQPIARVGQAIITALAVGAVVSARRVRPWLWPAGSRPGG
ncbi:MAG: hypothetical protein HOV79_20875 [Hamadaea sp.]|nr:hypothetical protein [Hamadaea sp.]